MAEDLHNIDEFFDYLEGNLSAAEVNALEKRLDENEEEMETLKVALRVKTSAYLAGREKLRAKLSAELQDIEASRPSRSIAFQWWHFAAAAISIVAIGSWFFLNNEISGEELFSMYYKRPPAFEYRGETSQNALNQAFKSYKNNDFAAAILQFKQAAPEENKEFHNEIAFFKGISLVETKEWQQALSEFTQIQAGQYLQDAKWFSALIHLQIGDIEKAKDILVKLKRDEVYNSRATSLLKSL